MLLTAIFLFAIIYAIASFDSTTKREIKIGVSLPLSGSLAYFGELQKEGALIAEQQINNNGGINGYTLKLIIEDNKGDRITAATVAEKLITVDDIDIILTAFTGPSAVTNSITSKNKKILLYESTNDDLAKSSNYTFKDYVSFEDVGKKLGDAISNEDITSIGLILPVYETSKELRKVLKSS